MLPVLGAAVLSSLLPTALLAATPRDALVMAWNLDALITLDPAQIGEVNGNDIIVGNVCTPLVNYDPADISRIVPGTAEAWSVSPDGLTITLTMRPDLQFPDGRAAGQLQGARGHALPGGL